MTAMVEALRADGPLADRADELMLLGRFVGSWDVEGWVLREDGSRREHRGEWHFGWVLGGRAIQDVLISPPLDEIATGAPTVEYGTTIRFYDAEAGAWRGVYVTPVNNAVVDLVARRAGEEILFAGRLPDGSLASWSFSEISDAGFVWQSRVSADGGRTWELYEELRATRR